MNDTPSDLSTTPTTSPVNSYVDQYTPPVMGSAHSQVTTGQPQQVTTISTSPAPTPTDSVAPDLNWAPPAASTDPISPAPTPSAAMPAQATEPDAALPAATSEPVTASSADAPSIPAIDTATSTDSSAPVGTLSQSLEDQNIFYLLGVQDGTDQEKEAFLDELQKVIWEDFMERDVELLITEEEMVDLKKITARKELSELDQQEQIITFLEKLIPDLEEIMLEKALELKEDMVRERIAGMREYYAGKDAQLGQLDKAEELMNDDQWRGAAEVLNSIS